MSAELTPVPIAMPRLSDSMEEGTVLAWLKAPGEQVACGEALVEIETDKATMVYEAETAGVLGELLVAEGEAAALGAPLALLLVEGAKAPAGAAQPATDGGEPAPVPADAAPADAPARGVAARRAGGRLQASPVARRLAEQLGVELDGLRGSGPRGRIVREDVLAAADAARAGAARAAPAQPLRAADGDEHLTPSATQRTIARRMVASRKEVPEFTVTAEIDMTAALALRRELAERHPAARVSVNDMIVKAAALVLREQPVMNASWVDDHVVRHAHVNVGIAVATDDALLVPVIPEADRKGLFEIAAAARAAGERARARSASPQELSGGTFTVTNLGMFGVLDFTAVIDVPQVAILAVGATVRRPVFGEDDAIVARDLMQVSLSSDHRAVYGADAARYLARLRAVLEDPMLLLLPPLGGPNEGDAR
jgi:pyruvate dehydrogenase E2 component (dihydrolipoamide acetyltransferase)